MALLDDEAKKHLKEHLKGLKDPVKIKMFTQEFECQFCKETRELVEAIGEASELVKVEVYDFVKDKDTAGWYGIDKIPAIVVEGKEDYGIRFFGIPAGYELTTLLEDIKMVSTGKHGLKAETVKALNELKNPVHIKVFVTLTCPYCPAAVHMAHKMAFASPLVKAEMIESAEFPHLANRYGVMSVPRVFLNEKTDFTGALPEKAFLNFVLQAAEKGDGEQKSS